jgi:ADP-ribosylglycohydrolase
MFPDIDGYHFIFGRGMFSDDTDHMIFTTQALLASKGEGQIFAQEMANRLRRWVLAIPAGVGLATLRACGRLLVGISPEKSGVYSAGAGPAMRSAIIGVLFGTDEEKMRELNKICSQITHTDPKAEFGAYAVALAASMASRGKDDPERFISALEKQIGGDGEEAEEFLNLVRSAASNVTSGGSAQKFADSLGLDHGVTGYVYHIVPVAIRAWFAHRGDYLKAIQEVIKLGGDTDTSAAVAGAIVGAGVGASNIPESLVNGLFEWPMTIKRINEIAENASKSVENWPKSAKSSPFLAVFARNGLFTITVLIHGFRRLLPPY